VAQRAGNGKKAIVTGLQPYAANRIAVDLDSLPIDVLVTSPEQRVVPGFRQAVRVSFGGVASRPTTLWLSDSGGEPLPTGATAMIGNEPPAIVGQGGEVYVADAHPGDPIMVRGADMQCRAIVPPLPLDVHAPRIGPVTCTPVKEDERK
jgi:outer membrane usher protein